VREAKPTPALTAHERHQRGRRRRRELPLDSHAEVCDDDAAQAVLILAAQDVGRDPALLAGRYDRLLVSPLAFLRGSAAVMAADLASSPSTELDAQLCGDAHLSNFGLFASPERRLVFDINDFDETASGPFEWDVKRLATSIALVGDQNGHSERERERAVLSAVRAYREAMRGFCEQKTLTVWYRTLELDALLSRMSERMPKAERKAAERTRRTAVAKGERKSIRMTTGECGERRFVSRAPDIVRLDDLYAGSDKDAVRQGVLDLFDSYLDSLSEDRRSILNWFTLRDVARKAVGVGSYGLGAYLLLLTGPHEDDLLVLQLKEARDSVLAPYLPNAPDENGGRRVVSGQRRIQAASDAFLGWQERAHPDGGVTSSYMRQYRDGKRSADVEAMDAAHLAVYGQLCGWTLARAHARTGDRFAIAGYLGDTAEFEEALVGFADTYRGRLAQQLTAVRAADRGVPAPG
jgi:uncharacterized protein (DUF2252 family)